MKRTASFLLTVVLLLTMMFTTACAADNNDSTKISLQIGNPVMIVNGTDMNIDDSGTTPVIVNNRTLLPVRAVIEAVGGKVDWEQETRTVTLTYGGDTIKLIIDSKTAYLNGEVKNLDVAPVIINDRTMLPIRFIGESFGFAVDWEQTTQTVSIEVPKKTETEPAADESKTLVVYFSATNTTKGVAEKIAKCTNADIFELEPTVTYTDDDLDWTDENSRVCKEHEDENRKVELVKVTPENFDSYDTVYIGYPIWWHSASWVVDEFVKNNDFTGKTVIPFCTSASSPYGESGAELALMAGTGNWIDGARFTGRASESEIKNWIDGLELTSAAASAVETPQSKSLVAYFSRTGENYSVGVIEKGNTEIIAEMIAEETGADLFEIKTVKEYPVGYEDCKMVATQEQNENARPELKSDVTNFDDYDTIYLGYPIWYGDMPMAVYTFLESYDFDGKTIIPFCTHAGSGLSGTESNIKNTCAGAEMKKGLAVSGATAQNNPDSAKSAVKNWLYSLD